jgi:DNA repair exonuclease SbcCD ATPase subunit
LSQKIAKLTLPFSVSAENRTEPFTEEMEKAALYCFAEAEREKGGGLILRKAEERTAFLAKFFYPFWLAPWKQLTPVFDGLKQSVHTAIYKTIPDTKAFLESAQRSTESLETYTAFLSDNINYFQTPSGENAITLEGLVSEPLFLNEFNAYLSEAKQIEATSSETVLLSPLIDEATVLSAIEELERLRADFEKDIRVLQEGIKLLSKTTKSFAKEIRGKIRAVREEFEEAIRKEEEIVAQKVNRINEEYNEQRVKLIKSFEKQRLPLQKEKVKLEKTREQTLRKIEHYNIEAKTCAIKKDAVGERKWKEKANETRKELSEIDKRLEEVEEKIKEIDENESAETFKIRSEWESKIKEVRKNLLELESSRDAKIQIHKQEMERLEGLTASIIQQMSSTVKLREADLANITKPGIQQEHEHLSLVHMPFYMACYEAELKKRYVVFPPSTVNSIGFIAKLKGALGRAKIKQLLTPRFKAITSLLEKLPALMEKDAVFAREIHEAGERANMLGESSKQKSIGDGLKKLKDEGWLSDKDFEALNHRLTAL